MSEICLDTTSLIEKLHQTPDIITGIKDKLKSLYITPTTLEELNNILDLTCSGENFNFPDVDIKVVELGIKRADYLMLEGDDDYV